jgi:ubiquinone/menaquinone biosynthesis C-methylase UbiE
MQPLYLSPEIRCGFGPHLRPGGTALTSRILELTKPDPAAVICDAGCGTGTTVGLLKQTGYSHAFGFDLSTNLLKEGKTTDTDLVCGRLERIPVLKDSIDLLICECAWNLSNTLESLAEFARILRPGGRLALIDIHLRGDVDGQWPIDSCLAAATNLDTVRGKLLASGFTIFTAEDHSALLTRAAAEYVFAHGSLQGFWQTITGNAKTAQTLCQLSAASRPGLFLMIGERLHE